MRGSAIATSVALAVGLTVGLTTATPVAAQPRGEDESAELVDAGRRALTAGELGAAARALDAALALNPRRVEAYLLRAAVWAAAGKPARGVALLRKARELAPTSDDVVAALGTQLVLADQLDEGVPLLEAVVARAPERYQAQALLGYHYARGERWREAVLAIEAYRASRPAALAAEDDRHLLDLAQGYLRTNRVGAARTIYDGLVVRHPEWMAARLGQAWAAAAADCRVARPLLAAIAKDAQAPRTVVLVDGQCALETAAFADARRLATRYLAVEPDSAPATALLGEAEAGLGNLDAAIAALSSARAREPDRPRYAVRLARVLGTAGRHDEQIATLAAISVPPTSPDYRNYWVEYARALANRGRLPEVYDGLRAAVVRIPDDPELVTWLGLTEHRRGDRATAVATLERALTLGDGGGGFTRGALAEVLVDVGELALAAGDLAEAERTLARADAVAPGLPVWRALAATRLAGGDAAGAIEVLGRAPAASLDDVARIVLARAHVQRGGLATARALLAPRDVAAPTAAEVALELAALELVADQPELAVAALTALPDDVERTAPRVVEALATARHAAAVAALRAGQATRALALLDEVIARAEGEAAIAAQCDAALAAVAIGDRDRALTRLRAVAKLGCRYGSAADAQAVPVLTAFVDGLAPRRAAAAVTKLTSLHRSSTGVTKALAGSALRVIAMTAAERAYRDGKLPAARKLLAAAKDVAVRAGSDELAYDLAALDLADGKVELAKAGFARIAARVPEALIGAGIAADRAGDGAAALELWRQARRAGAKLSTLDEWIAAKERIYGGGGR